MAPRSRESARALCSSAALLAVRDCCDRRRRRLQALAEAECGYGPRLADTAPKAADIRPCAVEPAGAIAAHDEFLSDRAIRRGRRRRVLRVVAEAHGVGLRGQVGSLAAVGDRLRLSGALGADELHRAERDAERP